MQLTKLAPDCFTGSASAFHCELLCECGPLDPFFFLLAKDPVDRHRGKQGTVLHLVPPSTHLMGVYEVQYCVKCRSERYCPLVCNVAVNFER